MRLPYLQILNWGTPSKMSNSLLFLKAKVFNYRSVLVLISSHVLLLATKTHNIFSLTFGTVLFYSKKSFLHVDEPQIIKRRGSDVDRQAVNTVTLNPVRNPRHSLSARFRLRSKERDENEMF